MGRSCTSVHVANEQELARQNPAEIQVLNTQAFFSPLWTGDDVSLVHEKDEYDFYGTGQYA